jgi:hypothetical protein
VLWPEHGELKDQMNLWRWLNSWAVPKNERQATLAFFRRPTRKSKSGPGRSGYDPSFDVICFPPTYDPKRLTHPELILDQETLARHYASVPNLLGAIEPRWGSRFSLSIAKRIVRRLARHAAGRLDLDRSLIEKAWFFSVWTEVCTLIPARRLARHLARLAQGELILIPIRSTDIRCLSYWGENGLEPFYLSAALRRLGAKPLLWLTNPVVIADEPPPQSLTLQFSLDPGMWPRAAWPAPTGLGGVALALAGVRGYARLLSQHPLGLKIGTVFRRTLPDATLLVDCAPLPKIALTCEARQIGRQEERIFIYSPRNDELRLDDQFVALIGATSKSAAQRASDLANEFELNEAYVCDHLFFESALIAHAVRARGGAVFLWPHSSNAAHALMYEEGDVAAVRCTTNSSARVWSGRLPDTLCVVQSDLILQPCAGPRASTPGDPLTIVVFASVHALLRMPFVDRRGHEDSYRRLFRALKDMAPQVRILFKPKWESTEWLRGVLGPSIVFEETNSTALELDEPNMIYMTVSYGSTALLEGLGRGIPCMIVREAAVEDYTGIDPAFVPITTVEDVVAQVERCKNPADYDALTRRELIWYAQETNFGSA